MPQLQEEFDFFGTLEVHGLRETLGEGVLKISNGSLVVLKGI